MKGRFTMTALSASYDSCRKDGALLAYPVTAGAHIFKGALLAVSEATGLVQPASDTAGLVFAGVAYEAADNTGGTAGAKSVRVLKTGVFTQPKTGAALTDVGKAALIVDDTTVATTATTNSLVCGIVVGFPDSAHVSVRIDTKVN
jgi:predicted RecA/RadA family phage recombinase